MVTFQVHKDRKMVAIYVRKSRLKTGDDMEIDRQIELLVEYAEANNMDYEIFAEEGSSEDWDGRPELQRMLMALKNGIYDGILVTDQDRLTRDRTDFGLFQRFARTEGLLLFTLSKTYNFLNDDDTFTSGIQSEMDNHFMRMTKRKLKRGRIQAIKKGVYFGKAPYGYGKDEQKHLYPHPEESKVVELIFDLFANEGYNMPEIEEELELRGILNRKGKPLCSRSISIILNNLAYRGTVHYELTDEDVIIVEEAHPALVDSETWLRVQRIRAERRHVPQSAQRGVYILSGLLTCSHPECRQVLSFCQKYSNKEAKKTLDKSARELFVLNCHSSKGQQAKKEFKASGKPKCKNNGIKASRVEEAVFAKLREHTAKIDAYVERVLSGKSDFLNKVARKQNELTLSYNQLETQKKNVQDGFKLGIYDGDEAQREIMGIKEKQIQIQQELKELEGADSKAEVDRQLSLKKKIEHLLTMDKTDFSKVNKLLHEIAHRVYYWKEESDRDRTQKQFVVVIDFKVKLEG